MSWIANYLFSPKCICCGQLGELLCERCCNRIHPFQCVELDEIEQCWAASDYRSPLRDAVLAYKSGHKEFGSVLATALGRVIRAMQSQFKSHPLFFDEVVAIPSSKVKIAERGFDTIGEVANKVAQTFGVRHIRALRLLHDVQDQVGLKPQERLRNRKNAFCPMKEVSPRILLIDDVVTTGATVMSAAETLKIAGAQKIFVVSVCRTLGRSTV